MGSFAKFIMRLASSYEKMARKAYLLALLCFESIAFALSSLSNHALELYTITAPNITAKFIPYGARLTSLLVPDRHGHVQDVVLGYDSPEQYVNDTETAHTYFGAVIGRYANRIKNGTFEVEGIEHHIPLYGSHASFSLHGGKVGYDQRNWTVSGHTSSSITFTLYDSGFEGFPGDVVTYATYTVSKSPDGHPQLTTKLISISLTRKTPIMLTNHIYWNLNAFQAPTIGDDTWLQLPLSHKMIGTDQMGVPTGRLLDVTSKHGGAMDFLKGKLIGADMNETAGLCGKACMGYDECMIVDRPEKCNQPDGLLPIVRMHSRLTGISMEVMSNQPAVQIYTCNGIGSIPVKQSQVKRNRERGHSGVEVVRSHGCIAIEPEGWIDGINNPQWDQRRFQVFGPMDEPAMNLATYRFGTMH